MAALPIYVHVPKFYADTLGMSLAGIGAILLAARIVDALQDPLFGWWSDRTRSRGGSRWVFVGAGAPLLAAAMAGLFHPPAAGSAGLEWWLVANLVLVYTAFSLVTVSYQAHGAEIADDIAQRTRVTAWREGFALAGVFLAAALPELLRQSLGDREGYSRFSMLFAPLVLAAAFLTIRGSPEPHASRPPHATRRRRWTAAQSSSRPGYTERYTCSSTSAGRTPRRSRSAAASCASGEVLENEKRPVSVTSAV